jgi:hypothetical protein
MVATHPKSKSSGDTSTSHRYYNVSIQFVSLLHYDPRCLTAAAKVQYLHNVVNQLLRADLALLMQFEAGANVVDRTKLLHTVRLD